jgi:hypothetical protein
MAKRYDYCLVEGTYVVRKGQGSRDKYQWLTPDGQWLDYADDWDVITNGRPLANEQEALETAQECFERYREWWAEHYPQYKMPEPGS